MNKESLIIARDIILKLLDECDKIENIDKLEIMLNLNNFLSPEEYQENVKVLNKNRNKGRFRK